MTDDSPQKVANRLAQLLKIVKGDDRFPVKIQDFAMEYSKDICPNKDHYNTCINKDCICGIAPMDLSQNIDGVLKKTNNGWLIVFNKSIQYGGRINFTLAHELGHYLLHREKFPDGLTCSKEDIQKGNLKRNVENEANIFASYLLMPLDDFRDTASKYKFSPDLFYSLSQKYETSLTASILKWIEMTSQQAMVVFSDNGFILWCRQSDALIKTKSVPYKFSTQEVPSESLTYKVFQGSIEQHAKNQTGVWWGKGLTSQEIVFMAPQLESAITVVLYEENGVVSYEEGIDEDCFDLITTHLA